MSSNCNDITFDSCITYSQAKQTRLSFQKGQSTSHKSFDLVHVDVWGPYKQSTHDGFKYFLTIVDDFTRHIRLHLLNNKISSVSFMKIIYHSYSKSIQEDYQYYMI